MRLGFSILLVAFTSDLECHHAFERDYEYAQHQAFENTYWARTTWQSSPECLTQTQKAVGCIRKTDTPEYKNKGLFKQDGPGRRLCL